MAIGGYPTDETLGKVNCNSNMDAWHCPNMKPKENDIDMNYKNYECKKCGKALGLDYNEKK